MKALITGSASGIGAEFAKLFASKKYDIIAVDIDKEKLDQQKQQLEQNYDIKVEIIEQDLSKQNAVKEIFNRVKSSEVDILINDAGFGTFGKYTEVDWQRQHDLVMVNVMAVMELSYLFGQKMLKQGTGKIVNIASIASYMAGPHMATYYASKAFVRSLSESMSKELEGSGVSVTAICPGPTDTNFEKAAGMKNSLMFKFNVQSPEFVVRKSYKPIMQGKAVYVVGVSNKIIAFFTRFLSLKTSRNFASYINIGKWK